MARTDPTIYMRLPPELKERLDAAAASNHCSLTSEVVRRLESSFSTTTPMAGVVGGAQSALPLESSEERRDQLLSELNALDRESDSIRSLIDALERSAFMMDGDVNAVEAKRLDYESKTLYARRVVLEHRIKSIQREINLMDRWPDAFGGKKAGE